MNNLKLIIRREFNSRVRNRTFVVMTFLSPLIVVGMIMLIVWLTTMNKDNIKQVAFLDETGLFIKDFNDENGIAYYNYGGQSLEAVKDSVISKELYGLLYIPKKETYTQVAESIQFFAEDPPNLETLTAIEGKIKNKLTTLNYKQKGWNIDEIKQSEANVNIQIENFSGEKTSKLSNYVKMFFGGLAGYLLMMFIIIYGNMVMRSVIEEKTNRIIEIIISSVKPMDLMLGKILGTTMAGIVQFLIWVCLGAVLLFSVSMFLDIQPFQADVAQADAVLEASQKEGVQIVNDIWNLPLLTIVLFFFIYFIGGYFLYSSIYAAIGAAVDSETDSQQFMLPVILPLMLGIYVGFFSVIENPDGIISTVFSMIPLTSPVVMLMRIPFGVPWWQLVLSLSILAGTIFFMVWVAGKIYRIGILMYGKKTTYRELIKWLKY